MRTLGHLSQGTLRIAQSACDAVLAHGEVAVFLSRKTGEAAAVEYTSRDYQYAMRRHAPHLVGVYRDNLADNDGLFEQMLDDLACHVSAGRKAIQ
jgi:hypothetical protein